MSQLFHDLLQSYFLLEKMGGTLLNIQYDPILVVLSYLIAVFAAYTTLNLVGHMRDAYQEKSRFARYWWLGASITLGGGIFVMHFIAMLAFSIPVTIRYDLGITLLSIIASIGGSAIALRQIRFQQLHWRRLLAGSLLMGSGVAVMHYTGMVALLAPALLRYTPGLWLLSIAIAITVSLVALLLLYYIPKLKIPHLFLSKLLVALVMGAAVAGMHYTGMAAAQFYSGGSCGISTGLFNIQLEQAELGIQITIITLLIIGIGLIASLFNDRINSVLAERNQFLEQEVALRTHELIAANKAKDEFLANMSHEIRTPMNAITGLVYLLLQEEGINNRHQLQLKKIEGAANSLLGIINDILDYSKIQAGKLEIEQVPFQLESVIDNVVNVTTVMSREKDIELLVKREDQIPLHLVGDPLRLNQILSNLMSNAIKFTDQGMITLQIQSETPEAEHPTLIFSVSDSGIGMDEETLQQIFSPFEQADNSITRRFGGTGLGLSIVNQLVTLMKGQLRAESTLGEGSTFTVTLPFERSKVAINYRSYSSASFEKLRVLVVDDNPEAVQVLDQILRGFGCQTSVSYDAEHALKLVHNAESEENPFNFVLMDWRLPGMDGLTASEQIKQSSSHPPVIIIETAYGQQLLKEQGNRAEAVDALLTKPITPSHLFDTLIRFMEQMDPEQQEHSHKETISLQGLTILLVEDNTINQEVAKKMLEGVGASVLVANHGKEALNWIQQYGRKIDTILMDMQMPVMDGLQATREIRLQPQWREIPILAMTANARNEDKEACLQAGMDDHISKPIDPPLLFNTIRKWCKLSSTTASPPTHSAEKSITQSDESRSVIDLNQALQRLHHDRKALPPLLQQLKQQLAQSLPAIEEELQQGARQQAYHLAHNLKGATGNLATEPLYQQAAALSSQLLESENQTQERELLEQLHQASEAFLQQFEQIHNELGSTSPSAPTTPSTITLQGDGIEPLYNALREALQRKNFEAEDLLEQLIELQQEADQAALEPLRELVFSMQYEQALERLEQLTTSQ